jgi:hypothetical protein
VKAPGFRIRACQRCGSGELRMPSVGDGVIVGLGQDLSKMACERCGLVAVALEFEDEAARHAYQTSQSGAGGWTRVE